jgi:hypothetical protein
MDKKEKPSWWLCYLIWALMISLLAIDYWIPAPHAVHTLLACGIVLGCYGLIAWWLRANRSALASEDWEEPEDRPPARPRDVPLSPVQANYLRVMGRSNHH